MKTMLMLAGVTLLAGGCVSPSYEPSMSSMKLSGSYADSVRHDTIFEKDAETVSDAEAARAFAYTYSSQGMTRARLLTLGSIDEDLVGSRENLVAAFNSALSPTSVKVSQIPRILLPTQLSIANIREAALRMQSDLIIILTLNTRIVYESKLFTSDTITARTSADVALFDVHSGMIPFSDTMDYNHQATKQKEDKTDCDFYERARRESAQVVLSRVAQSVAQYVSSH